MKTASSSSATPSRNDWPDSDAVTVTVVTPAFRAEGFIEETIRSVHAQSHRPLQHVVVDDCSPDNQNHVIERLAGELSGSGYRIDLVRHDVNRGAAQALLTGIAAADGEAICWLSADDLFVDDSKTSEQIRLLDHVDITFDDACLEGPDQATALLSRPTWPLGIRRNRALAEWQPDAVLVGLLFQNPINGTSVMIRRDVLRDTVSFDPALGNLDADADFFLRASALGLTMRPRLGVGTLYRIHPGQTSQRTDAMAWGRALSRSRILAALADSGRLDELLLRHRGLLAGAVLSANWCSPDAVRELSARMEATGDRGLSLLAAAARRITRLRGLPLLPPAEIAARVAESTASGEFARFSEKLAKRDNAPEQ